MKHVAITLIITVGVVAFFTSMFQRVNESELNHLIYDTCGKQGVTCVITSTSTPVR